MTPVVLNRLFRTAARIDESALQEQHKNLSVQLSFFVFFIGVLGFRLGTLLHFDEDNVLRGADGEIIGIEVPSYDCCDRGEDGDICSYCQELAEAMANNDDDPDTTAEDCYGNYWAPKTKTGGRQVPVLHDYGRDIIERYLEAEGSFDKGDMTVRRRLTFLAEVTNGVDPDQMMPQSLRASAANYWITLEGFDVEALKGLMGWKYLTTANYYVATDFSKLWHKMSRALGKESTTPYDIETELPKHEEIRSRSNLIHVETVTPESDIVQHIYDYDVAPLEKEAQESRQALLSSPSEKWNAEVALDPITSPLRARLRYEYKRLKESPATNASPPIDRVATAGLGLIAASVFLGSFFALNGFLNELLARDPQAIATFATSVAISLPFMIWDVHETYHEHPQDVTPETLFDRVILWTHAQVNQIVGHYCSVRRAVSYSSKDA